MQVYEDNNDICLVLELMRGGDLFEAISKKMEGDGFYTEKDAAALARDIVSVVAKCHAESVIHRDIKVRRIRLQPLLPRPLTRCAIALQICVACAQAPPI